MAMNEFRREVAILKACRDPNIVSFLVGGCAGARVGGFALWRLGIWEGAPAGWLPGSRPCHPYLPLPAAACSAPCPSHPQACPCGGCALLKAVLHSSACLHAPAQLTCCLSARCPSSMCAPHMQGACLREDCAMLVTEYCEGGNLSRNILARKVSWYRRGRKVGRAASCTWPHGHSIR